MSDRPSVELDPEMAERLEALREELSRTGGHPSSGATAKVYVVSVVALCAMTIAGIVVAMVLVDDPGRLLTVQTTIIGVTGPVIATLLAGALAKVSHAMNSRLDGLLATTASLWFARGKADGQGPEEEGDGGE